MVPCAMTRSQHSPPSPLSDAAVMGWFAVSGAAGLMYEASWTRQLSLVLGSGERAAAVVLAAFFAGIAAGSWAASRMGALRPPLASVGGPSLRGQDLERQYVGDWARVPGRPLNTDEHPRVEFLAPAHQRSLGGPEGPRLEALNLELFRGLPRREIHGL